MNMSSVLVVYPTGGERIALDLVPHLHPLCTILLRSYEGFEKTKDVEQPDLALCVVVDDDSIDQAHALQKKLADIPTLVVDHTPGRHIPINGFAGLTPPSHVEIAQAVRRILQPEVSEGEVASSRKRKARAPLTSRFDATLSRLGDLPQSLSSMLAAATRQLARELRSEKAEACFIEEDHPKMIFELATPASLEPSASVVRLIANRTHLFCRSDLRKSERSLYDYLVRRGLNVLAPMFQDDELIAWIGLALDEELLTSDFLDDLHIATHLLSMSLPTNEKEESKAENVWDSALRVLNSVIILVERDGIVADLAGNQSIFGGQVERGESFHSIRNSRVREVIAEALQGNFHLEAWTDPVSEYELTCMAALMPNDIVAVQVHCQPAEKTFGPTIKLETVLTSLPLSVVTEPSPESTKAFPDAVIKEEDAESIRQCAVAAVQSNVKTLRMRVSPNGEQCQAVLYFETPKGEESHLREDISEAVTFAVHG